MINNFLLFSQFSVSWWIGPACKNDWPIQLSWHHVPKKNIGFRKPWIFECKRSQSDDFCYWKQTGVCCLRNYQWHFVLNDNYLDEPITQTNGLQDWLGTKNRKTQTFCLTVAKILWIWTKLCQHGLHFRPCLGVFQSWFISKAQHQATQCVDSWRQ